MMDGLQLDISMGKDSQYDSLEATYRNEGLSVGADHMVCLSISAQNLFSPSIFLLSSFVLAISDYLERMLG
jgi:hypothetical protein